MEERHGQRPRTPQAQLNWRLYRLCFAPVIAALLILAFSLGSPPAPLTSNLVPEAFEGGRAFSNLEHMASIAPSRQSGSQGDARLVEYLQGQLGSLGSQGSGGYSVSVSHVTAETTMGSKPQTLLIGQRAGTGTLAPLALIASRDSAAGGARAALSGTAALLELASVLAQGETRHPIYVIFSDGASSGDAAIVSWLESSLHQRLDAAIVLGDLAGRDLRRPLVQPFSTGFGSAPEELTTTVSAAFGGSLGIQAGQPSLASQLSHLALPLSVGEQGPLNGIGIPSVSVSLAGEHGPGAHEAVSEARLRAAGRGVLSAFYALDHGAEVSTAASTGLRLSGKVLSQWPIALLCLTLLLGPLLSSGDALVRLARKRGQHVRRWMLLPLLCAWPFALSLVSLRALAAIGLLHSPPNPVGASALRFGAGSIVALIFALALLAGCWWLWPRQTMASSPSKVPTSGVAGIAVLCCGSLLTLLVWLINPYTALLLILALHAWLLAVCPQHRPQNRLARAALVLLPALAPIALLVAYYALSLDLGPGHLLLEAMAMVGGGYVNFGGVLLWSIALGVLVAMCIATLGGRKNETPRVHPPPEDRVPVLYAGNAPIYRERVLR